MTELQRYLAEEVAQRHRLGTLRAGVLGRAGVGDHQPLPRRHDRVEQQLPVLFAGAEDGPPPPGIDMSQVNFEFASSGVFGESSITRLAKAAAGTISP